MGIRVGMVAYVLLIVIMVFSILTAFAEQPSLGAVADAAKGAEPGDVVLRWSTSTDCSPYTVNGYTVVECTAASYVIRRPDNTTVRLQPNFWNIVGGSGENVMRWSSREDKVYFYANMSNVGLRWNIPAWATPEVILVGRVPRAFGGADTVGGYPWLSLPMPASRIDDLNSIVVDVWLDLVKTDYTLTRYGLMSWFEDSAGNPFIELWVALQNNFPVTGTDLGFVRVPATVNGEATELVFRGTYTISGGGWHLVVFELYGQTITSGEVALDIKPLVSKAANFVSQVSGVSTERFYWTSLHVSVYSGGNSPDEGFCLGWVLHKATVLATVTQPSLGAVGGKAYKLVWSEEFDGPTINESVWSFEVGDGCPNLCGWGNNELEYYTEDNAWIENGYLVIEARKLDEPITGPTGVQHYYTSARLKTQGKFEIKYGLIVFRAKLPEGKGIWPALWLLGSNINRVGWPVCGEIDVMELLGHQPDVVYGTAHSANCFGGGGVGSLFRLPNGEKFSDDFHEFAIEWTPYYIKWYVDWQLYHVINGDEYMDRGCGWPFDQPFFIIVNVAVGGVLAWLPR
jgi:hypothetical protein